MVLCFDLSGENLQTHASISLEADAPADHRPLLIGYDPRSKKDVAGVSMTRDADG
jgi:hypothetical protein